jgi:hypothetical protein
VYQVLSQKRKKPLLASSCLSLRPSARMEQLGSHWTDFHEIWYFIIFRKSGRKFKFHQNLTKITGTLQEDLCTFTKISRWTLLAMRNISDAICRENQNTNFMFNNVFTKILPFMRFFHGSTAPSGPGPLHCRGFTITSRHTTIGRTPLDEWSAWRRDLYLTTHNTHNRQIFLPPTEIEPAIPTSERPQTHALDRAGTGIGPFMR